MLVQVCPDDDWKVRVLSHQAPERRFTVEFIGKTGDLVIGDLTREQAEALYTELGEYLR